VVTALEQFRAADIRLGICTNKPTEPAVDICEKLDLAQYFDVIVGAEPDQPKKPEPQSLLTCVAALDCAPDQAMYVGDSDVDYHTARNATVAFRLFEGGYLNTPLPNLDPSDQFADWDRHGIKVP
jgi:phosphoglycolate phosphatase